MGALIPVMGIAVGGLAIIAWMVLEAMKIKHGYAITDENGNKVGPSSRPEDVERIRELKAENSELRERLEAIGSRVETLERIATDKPSRLAAEIDALADLSKENT